MLDGLRVLARWVVRMFALIGLFSTVAFFSYEYHKDSKTARSGRCINSACEPGQKCSVRFKRHVGECE
jgi:hypothetical protein